MTAKHRTNRSWLVLAAISMVCAIALPAGATPPKCDTNQDLPGCGTPVNDQPIAGTTCNAIGKWGVPRDSSFLVEDVTDSTCIDVNANPGDWTVEIVEQTSGAPLRWLSLVIRDSVAPGDACDSVRIRKVPIPSKIILDGFESDNNPGIPGAWVNSCGTEYAEWVGDTYYADADPNVSSPLVFRVSMFPKDAKVTLNVTLP